MSDTSASAPKRLWDKGSPVDQLMQRLTVGNDYIIDKRLSKHDCVGSAGHVKMLAHCGLISTSEANSALSALARINEEAKRGTFDIPAELEDTHTAIENRLCADLGDVGKKVHTGRSRNDQVLLANRLFMRENLLATLAQLVTLIDDFGKRYPELRDIPLPGYTHLMPAMPSSVGMWLHGFIEGLLEQVRDGLAAYELLDVCPLGAAAGFGTSLPTDPEVTAKALGFARAFRSPTDTMSSRGRTESRLMHWLSQIGFVCERFAWDLLLFSSREFSYFTFPVELTTGSSIMPQKRNLDLAELLRGKAGKIRGALSELLFVTGKLPSSYHRDFQYTKEPLFRALDDTSDALAMSGLLIRGLQVQRPQIERCMQAELFATYEAEQLVQQGMPFRDAYRDAARKVQTNALDVDSLAKRYKVIQERIDAAMVQSTAELATLRRRIEGITAHVLKCEREVFEVLLTKLTGVAI